MVIDFGASRVLGLLFLATTIAIWSSDFGRSRNTVPNLCGVHRICPSMLRQVHNSNLNCCLINNFHIVFSGFSAQATNLILNRANIADWRSDSCWNCGL
ncbi:MULTISPECIES: hypothetical protein [unclassified Mycobacterium]|uniref:hypothetical protein n=1 Tax=unclassified Mycobacterium TaxID=2642494 RepID=UPI00114D48E6|nr:MULTISPECIES: hypothetical protein [unclassified Mycobacterium]